MTSKIFLMAAFFFLFLNQSEGNKSYHKEYFLNGSLKVEGWVKDGVKTDYWKFYNSNGTLAEEGHFQGDRRDAYWHFYDNSGQQLRSG
ncbi:MAG: hypothetical protein HKN31_12185, partial [Pricia sp.]|nr:hypothetical protein [Pricia sp.]